MAAPRSSLLTLYVSLSASSWWRALQSQILSDRETSDDKKMGQVGFEEKSILFYQGQHTNLF
ncbi:MAG: hypothetical protein DRQ24_04155 [Candidatus Latescibacterota bacterium]|nr:MAG: hypothetical protein DRQ24_04155 [Candidatus Latescibacterota bacterium]